MSYGDRAELVEDLRHVADAVGATIAYACMIRGVAPRIAIYDIDTKKVEAETLDLNHGLQFIAPAMVEGSDDPAVCEGADIIAITAGLSIVLWLGIAWAVSAALG